MKKSLILFLLLYLSHTLCASRLDSLFNVLDQTIKEQTSYVKVREERIGELKKKLARQHQAEQKYSFNKQLYEEYKVFICDSAIQYLYANYDLAEEHRQVFWKDETSLLLSYLLSSSGMYMESQTWLNKVNKQTLDKQLFPLYYSCHEHLYNELSLNTHDRRNGSIYWNLKFQYKDSLLSVLEPNSEEELSIRQIMHLDNKEFEKAEEINDIQLSQSTFGTPEYASTAFWRALLYRELHDMENYQVWLALSAISDIRSAIKDNASLCMLADYLYEIGDIDRSYTYIKQTLDDANFYNARLRSVQIANIQSVIDKTYQAKSDQQKKELLINLIMISILSILLLVALIYIYRQMSKLTIARNELQEVNDRLKEMNGELNQMNTRLQSINLELSESNHIKEEYIGHFLTLCSTYIDKLESYRRMVNKKITAGQIPDLLKTTKSTALIEKELEDFYTNFDTTFLHLYPSFVEDFNAMLLDEERIHLKKGELLNTELRIFALIRLGIEDSSKIAEFLRYSVNTIYNYRAKVKNKAKVSRDDFESLIMKIGSFAR